jgi:hypothetical protein
VDLPGETFGSQDFDMDVTVMKIEFGKLYDLIGRMFICPASRR